MGDGARLCLLQAYRLTAIGGAVIGCALAGLAWSAALSPALADPVLKPAETQQAPASQGAAPASAPVSIAPDTKAAQPTISRAYRRGRRAQPQEPAMTMEAFLDRLMMVESGGRAFAKNPLSTAIGPFQFIASTWLQVARTTFPDDIKDLKPHEILALRTDVNFARRAAHRYTMDNAAYLVANGQKATFPNLRLAHLVGAGGALRVLNAKPDAPVATLLGATVIGANPFMASLTAEELIGRASREIASNAKLDTIINPDPDNVAANVVKVRAKAKPVIPVKCNLSLVSCRKWLALAKRRLTGRRAQR